MKIVLLGELYSYNLGEPLLFDCSEYVIKEIDCSSEVYKIDMFGRKNKTNNMSSNSGIPFLYQMVRILRKLFSIMNLPTSKFDEWKWKLGKDRKFLKEYYRKEFEGKDGIIVMGAGTIKYDVRLNFAPYYKLIIQTAEELNVPVYINCAGIESRYNAEDKRCKMFEEALSNNIVKVITTRDELDELRKYVKNSDTLTDKIADIGTWAAETYHVQKNVKSETIGLGVITPKRFKEFGRIEAYEKYEKLWIELINELENKGIRWKIFNNGDLGDIAFAKKLCELIGKPEEEYVITPRTPQELVKAISGFKGIISSRLHSCIVAYSLMVPFVAISWNNKLQYFAREIAVQERIIGEERLHVETILSTFFKSIEEGYDVSFYKEFRKTSKEYMDIYMQSMKKMRKYK